MLEIKCFQVAFYDLTRDGKCFDESFFAPDEADTVFDYIDCDFGRPRTFTTRVFVYFTDGHVFELKTARK